MRCRDDEHVSRVRTGSRLPVKTERELVVVHSATLVRPQMRGQVVVTGSHGGRYPAASVAAIGIRAAVFNDAGVGRDAAGVAGLAHLDEFDIPAVAVGHDSARIGFGYDALGGVVTHVNRAAARLGCMTGMDGASAVALLARAQAHAPIPVPGSPTRYELADRVRGADSAALLTPDDAGTFVVTGSHGGLLGGDPQSALRIRPVGSLFNDACGGRDGAGTSRLAALQDRGIPAGTVSAHSARIGDARSTYTDGIVSAVNDVAAARGGVVGMSARDFVSAILATAPRSRPGGRS